MFLLFQEENGFKLVHNSIAIL